MSSIDNQHEHAQAGGAGSFLNPAAPIPSQGAAKGRIRLAGLLGLLVVISAAVSLGDAVQTLFGDRSEEGRAGPDIVLAGLLAYGVAIVAFSSIAMLFAQRLWVVGLFVNAAGLWVGIRLVLTFQQLGDARGVIVGALNFVFACFVALVIVHALRSALYLYEARRRKG